MNKAVVRLTNGGANLILSDEEIGAYLSAHPGLDRNDVMQGIAAAGPALDNIEKELSRRSRGKDRTKPG